MNWMLEIVEDCTYHDSNLGQLLLFPTFDHILPHPSAGMGDTTHAAYALFELQSSPHSVHF